MKFLIAGTILCTLFINFVFSTNAATRVPGTDRRTEIISVIQAQMDAFKQDDGRRAFSYATSQIQELFQNSEKFMSMVRTSYQPVYRPQSVSFLELLDINNVPIQQVRVTGPDGLDYFAFYEMKQLPNGEWKIAGCFLAEVQEGTNKILTPSY